jgi:DNA-binding CsgD family transcriptional regulator
MDLDFHTPPYQLFFREAPDYNLIRKKTEILDSVSKISNQTYFIIDLFRNNYFYISPNPIFNCGYKIDEIKKMGPLFPNIIIYGEDKPGQIEIKNAVLDFMANLDKKNLSQVNLFSTHRIIDKSKSVFSILNQYRPFLLDDNNKVWMILGTTYFSTKNHFTESYIEIEDRKERFLYSTKKKEFVLSHSMKISHQEQKILIMASMGYTSKEIASKMNISLSTVKYHKQNILIKFNVRNIPEAILYSYSHSMI